MRPVELVNEMAGIIFFRTTMLQDIVDFYVNEAGMHIWLEQAECVILNHGNFLLGFCERDVPETQGCITLFYPTKEDVDVMYDQLKHISTSEPVVNDRYEIYQFFTEDPEGRTLEFQAFLHPIEPVGFF